MRVFIAIDIPQEKRKEIIKIQATLPEFKGKKTEQENQHLTLKFLGEINEKELEIIKHTLSLIKVKQFETEIDVIGVFDPNLIRIIWLHMSNCDELQKEVDKKLASMFMPENRFMSHLTIARVKNVKDRSKFLKELEKTKFDKNKKPLG